MAKQKNTQTVEWHQELVATRKANTERALRHIEGLIDSLNDVQKETTLLELQINTAHAQGKKDFDRDLYLRNMKIFCPAYTLTTTQVLETLTKDKP